MEELTGYFTLPTTESGLHSHPLSLKHVSSILKSMSNPVWTHKASKFFYNYTECESKSVKPLTWQRTWAVIDWCIDSFIRSGNILNIQIPTAPGCQLLDTCAYINRSNTYMSMCWCSPTRRSLSTWSSCLTLNLLSWCLNMMLWSLTSTFLMMRCVATIFHMTWCSWWTGHDGLCPKKN